MISICMITYNHGEYIAKAIENVLRQNSSYRFQVIIGEDFSTDNTRAVCTEYAAKHPGLIKLLTNRKNIGMIPNFIQTLRECDGKYVAICEGDDYWTDPCKLQKQVDFLENNPDYVLAHHNAKTINENGNLINESNLPPANRADLSAEDLKKGKIISTLTICFRNIIKEFPQEFYKVPIPDMFLVSLLGRHGKAKYMPEIEPAMYREHSGGVWSSLNLQKRTGAKIKTWYMMAQYFRRAGDNELYKFYFDKVSASYPTFIKLSFLNRDFKETIDASSRFLFNIKWKELRNVIGA